MDSIKQYICTAQAIKSLFVLIFQASNETEYKAMATLRMALCVPSPCKAAMVEAAMATAFRPVNAIIAGLGYHVTPTLAEEYTAIAGPWRKSNPGDFVIM